MAVTPNGKVAYATNAGSFSISACRVVAYEGSVMPQGLVGELPQGTAGLVAN